MDACRARRRRWPALVLVAGLMAMVATACGPHGSGPTPPRSDALMAYHVSGGIAGIDERLLVSRDGAVVHTAGASGPPTAAPSRHA